MTMPTVASLLQGFFTERLVRQLQASPQTISAYRDTIKLLLMFAAQKTKKTPSRLTIDDLDAVTVGAFLSYLDNERHNSTATHNARLAAIHSFYRYALPLIPDRAHTASQVLAIPQRRHDRAIVSYLTSSETDALLAAPDRTTWYGRRDHTTCTNVRAPSRTRTDTVRILSPLPLPIGLWGPRSSERLLGRFSLVLRFGVPQRYRSAIDGLAQRIGHAGQIVVEEMAVSIERHRSCRVPQESLHNLDVSACTDRQ
jgi:integrase